MACGLLVALSSYEMMPNGVMFRAFPTILKSATRVWFNKLSPGTIANFEQLSKNFVLRIMPSRLDVDLSFTTFLSLSISLSILQNISSILEELSPSGVLLR